MSLSDDSQRSFRQFDVDEFNENGYVVIPNFLHPETVNVLNQRVIQLLDEFAIEGHPMTKFSTGENEAHVGDEVSPLLTLLINSTSSLLETKFGISWRKRQWTRMEN